MRTLSQIVLMFLITALGGSNQNNSFGQTPKSGKATKSPKGSTSPFVPTCGQPFGANASAGLSIDRTCGEFGNAAENSAEGQQNRTKNNFCAKGSAKTVTPGILLQLQGVFAADAAKKDILFGGEKQLPRDRTMLKGFVVGGQTYGEGDLVRMVAFIIESHSADLSSGESVNCDAKGDATSNDIHIALGSGWGTDECTSVTAEMSPHFRPDSWKILNEVKPKGKTKTQPKITQFSVRVTGQLMLDASHELCKGGKEVPGNPARQSMWEIHPVYAMDVCSAQDLSSCKVDSTDQTLWTPLENWKGGQ